MFQIFLNFLIIFIVPILIGALTRLVFIKKQKGYKVSIVFGCIFVATSLCAVLIPSHGNEGPGLSAAGALCALLSSLICGLISLIIKKVKHEN